jgi:hypothetical protein
MANRKATFAKRQRETDLKDHAKAKEGRRIARRDTPKTSKGPEIAWDEAVREEISAEVTADAGPTPFENDSAGSPSDAEPPRPAPAPARPMTPIQATAPVVAPQPKK